MGGLIPTPNDQDVISKLNLQFAGYGLASLRTWCAQNNENLFDGGHSLHRVAWRLGIYPNNAQGQVRWIYFLRTILRPASGGKTVAAIKTVLEFALANSEVNSVVFNVLEDPNVDDYFLYPNNQSQPVPSSDTVEGQIVYLVTLVCPSAASFPAQMPSVPPPSDPGENPNPAPFPNPIPPIVPPIPPIGQVPRRKRKRRK